ncbi:MAG: hypothetical protein J7K53_12280 [Bacteroidales bacterium]|nr:hypothetical protein [Bacteroidales bacterium]
MKIRNYGILSSRSKTSDLARARKSLKCKPPGEKKKFTLREVLLITKGIDVEKCPFCGGKMVVTKIIKPLRGPSQFHRETHCDTGISDSNQLVYLQNQILYF